jgi:hypothetical protein
LAASLGSTPEEQQHDPTHPRGIFHQVEAAVANVVLTGQSYSKSEAVVDAEKAIDRALAPKKVRLVPLPRRWD